MKVLFCLLSVMVFLSPAYSTQKAPNIPFEADASIRPKIRLKAIAGLIFYRKNFYKTPYNQQECDTIVLKDGFVIYADIIKKDKTVLKIKPCGEPESRVRTLNRDLIQEVRYSKKGPQGPGKANLQSLRFGILAWCLVGVAAVLALASGGITGYGMLFIVGGVATLAFVFAMLAIIMGISGRKAPQRKLGRIGLVLGVMLLLAAMIAYSIAQG